MTYYVNKYRSERQFVEGDEVFVKLQAFKQTSLKDVKDNKLTPRFFGPYKILKRIGAVAYRLQLPQSSKVHNTFHVSLLKKKVGNHILVQQDTPFTVDFPAPSYPSKILDRKLINRNNKPVVMALVQWEGMLSEDATWIDYDILRRSYPQFVGEDALTARRGHCHNEAQP